MWLLREPRKGCFGPFLPPPVAPRFRPPCAQTVFFLHLLSAIVRVGPYVTYGGAALGVGATRFGVDAGLRDSIFSIPALRDGAALQLLTQGAPLLQIKVH
jgi:hypothetical protein